MSAIPLAIPSTAVPRRTPLRPATPGPMLSYNVAALLRSAPGTARTYHVSLPTLPIAEDVRLAAPVTGDVRLQRTGRSILARGHVATAFVEPCARCLKDTTAPVEAEFE